MGIIRVLVLIAFSFISLISILSNFRKTGKENPIDPRSLTTTGKIIFFVGVPIFIVVIIFQLQDFNNNNKLTAELISNHKEDILQRALDKRETIDKVNESLSPIKLALNKDLKVISTVNNVVVNNTYNGLKQRHLTTELLNRITTTIKNKNEYVDIYSILSDKESETLRNEITDKFKSMNYHIMRSMSLNGGPNLSIPQLYDSVLLDRHYGSINANGDTTNWGTSILIFPLSNAN